MSDAEYELWKENDVLRADIALLRDELSWLRIEADKLLLENRVLRREIDFWSSKV